MCEGERIWSALSTIGQMITQSVRHTFLSDTNQAGQGRGLEAGALDSLRACLGRGIRAGDLHNTYRPGPTADI